MIDKKIAELQKITFNFPFIQYYSHTECDMYKILNEYTNYKEEKLVLCKVSEGFERALDLAIEELKLVLKYNHIDSQAAPSIDPKIQPFPHQNYNSTQKNLCQRQSYILSQY